MKGWFSSKNLHALPLATMIFVDLRICLYLITAPIYVLSPAFAISSENTTYSVCIKLTLYAMLQFIMLIPVKNEGASMVIVEQSPPFSPPLEPELLLLLP